MAYPFLFSAHDEYNSLTFQLSWHIAGCPGLWIGAQGVVGLAYMDEDPADGIRLSAWQMRVFAAESIATDSRRSLRRSGPT